jgi:diphthamide synthase subunit DPH2
MTLVKELDGADVLRYTNEVRTAYQQRFNEMNNRMDALNIGVMVSCLNTQPK